MADDRGGQDIDSAFAQRVFLLGSVVEGGFSLVAIGLAMLFSLPHPMAAMKLTVDSVLWGIVGAIPPFAFTLLFLRLPFRLVRELVRLLQRLFVPLLRQWNLAQIFLVCALAGFGEEVLFRGVVQPLLAGPGDTLVDQWLGIIGAGMLFGLIHAITPLYLVFATSMGIYLGALYLITDNLLVAVITHGLYDFLACVYLARHLPGPG